MMMTPSLSLPQASLLSPLATLGFLRRPLLAPCSSLPSNKLLLRRHFQSPTIAAASRVFAISKSPETCIAKNDVRYGKKQVISLTPPLYDYILSNVREPSVLRELREETATLRGSQMQVSPDQAQLLAMLVQIIGAQRCIEVGIYTAKARKRMKKEIEAIMNRYREAQEGMTEMFKGYSSLAVALVLPESGYLVACERDARCLEIAKRYYERAGVFHKVDVKLGLAADTLKFLISNGEACSYDFAFVDADKRMYPEYFELLLELVRIGGLIVIDNVLWHGKVADPLVNDPKTISIRNFNRSIFEDQRISISMVPIGDGITICRKK